MKRAYARSTPGFTIVELLIVIVVIGILAAISIVAYNGVSNNANDTAVKSDLANLAKKVQLVHAETGTYPAGGRVHNGTNENGDYSQFPGLAISLTKQSYHGSQTPTVIGYCSSSNADAASQKFRILARSKSGRYFEYTSMQGLVDLGTGWRSIFPHLDLCDGFGRPYSYAYGNNNSTGVWHDWAK